MYLEPRATKNATPISSSYSTLPGLKAPNIFWRHRLFPCEASYGEKPNPKNAGQKSPNLYVQWFAENDSLMKTVFFWIEVLPCLTKPFQNWNLSHMFVPRETRQKGGTLHTYEVVVPASLYVCRALGTLPKQKRPKARWKRWKRFGQIRIDLRLPFLLSHKS